jgi:seryl-tRNA synthetase
MLDLNKIKDNPNLVVQGLQKRGWQGNFDDLLEKVSQKNQILVKIEKVRAEVNSISTQVAQLKKQKADVQPFVDKVRKLNASITEDQEILKNLEHEINEFLHSLPNLPDEDVCAGGKDKNEVIKTYGEKPVFTFPSKNHMDLTQSLGLIDYQRSSKISGAGTWVYSGVGAQLEWALLNFFITEHLNDGYTFILPSHLLTYESGFTAGQFPKFADDVYWFNNDDNKRFLLPTAETALVNIHRNEILKEDELPFKYFAYTPCYRREAGSYRTEERGMIRGHQFNKVEMFQFTTEEGSNDAFNELVNKAINLMKKLGLHFRVSKLAAEDISHAMAKTLDIEVYLPSLDMYKEVSSVSNARDYQARRGAIRYRRNKDNKIAFCHTLNGSGLATSRLIPAIVEQFQNEEGEVVVPQALVPFLGGVELLKKLKR